MNFVFLIKFCFSCFVFAIFLLWYLLSGMWSRLMGGGLQTEGNRNQLFVAVLVLPPLLISRRMTMTVWLAGWLAGVSVWLFLNSICMSAKFLQIRIRTNLCLLFFLLFLWYLCTFYLFFFYNLLGIWMNFFGTSSRVSFACEVIWQVVFSSVVYFFFPFHNNFCTFFRIVCCCWRRRR